MQPTKLLPALLIAFSQLLYAQSKPDETKSKALRQLLTHRAGLPLNPIDWVAYSTKELKERRLAILKDNLNR